MNETVAAYGRVTQISHWLSALLILAMIPIGLIMTRIEAGSGQDSLYRTHVAPGLVILALTGIRLGALVFKR